MSIQHVEDSLNKVRAMFDAASARIEALHPGEKVPATVLAEKIGTEHGMTGAQAYPILKILFTGYPGVEILRGAHGGIKKVVIATPTDLPVVDPTEVPIT